MLLLQLLPLLVALFVEAMDEFVALLGQAVRLANGSHVISVQLRTHTDESPSQTEKIVKERAAPGRLRAVLSRSVTSLWQRQDRCRCVHLSDTS